MFIARLREQLLCISKTFLQRHSDCENTYRLIYAFDILGYQIADQKMFLCQSIDRFFKTEV